MLLCLIVVVVLLGMSRSEESKEEQYFLSECGVYEEVLETCLALGKLKYMFSGLVIHSCSSRERLKI